MMKISKIQEKETIEVLAQENCTVVGKPHMYIKGQDCLKDCTKMGQPSWYQNKHV